MTILAGMDCLYINLDAQKQRRKFVESNFAMWADPGWKLHRYRAVSKEDLPDRFRSGRIRDSEKACFASHVGALEHALEFSGDTLIVEDDVWFGPQSANVINESRRQLHGRRWDILFADLCVPDPQAMLTLFQMRRACEKSHQFRLLDPKSLKLFAGATAYLVNASSKGKLLEMFSKVDRIDVPYDLQLRNWIKQDKLTSFVIFPFATSLSKYADSSQIQLNEYVQAEHCMNDFRRLACADAGHPELPTQSGGVAADDFAERDLEAFLSILKVRLSSKFPLK